MSQTHFNKIPNTSIEIHKSITDYLLMLKSTNLTFYAAKGKSIQVRCMNDVGSVIVADEGDNIFEDISSRYKFEIDDEVNEIHLSGDNVLLALDLAQIIFTGFAKYYQGLNYYVDWSKLIKY